MHYPPIQLIPLKYTITLNRKIFWSTYIYYTVYCLEQNLPIYRNFQFGFTDIVFTTVKKNMSLEKKIIFPTWKHTNTGHTCSVYQSTWTYTYTHMLIFIYNIHLSTCFHTWRQKGSWRLIFKQVSVASQEWKGRKRFTGYI